MRYYIADCHFFHKKLNDNMDCRGFASVEEMNVYMLKKWNAKVRPEDEVVILWRSFPWKGRRNKRTAEPAAWSALSDYWQP
ncbi:MAG: hypothetical protein V8T31_06200 [Lachnospiraceae bacterium]